MGADLPYWPDDYLDFAGRYGYRHAVGVGEAQPPGLLGGGLAGCRAEFAEDCRHVVLYSPDRYEQAGGDLLVGMAPGKEVQDLLLARGQPSWVGLGCHTHTCRNGADAKVSHRPAYQTRRRFGTK